MRFLLSIAALCLFAVSSFAATPSFIGLSGCVSTDDDTCDGTQSILAGDVETFENGTGTFCASEISVYANVDGGVVSTYSTNAGTLIDTIHWKYLILPLGITE